MISPKAAAQMALYFLYKYADNQAPIILPGKANGEPSASTLRNQEVLKAAPTENLAPTITAKITFIIC